MVQEFIWDETPAQFGWFIVRRGVCLLAMSDLVCTECGATASYADASISDSLRSCGGDRTVRDTAVGPVQNGSEHEWVERMNSDIDVVTA